MSAGLPVAWTPVAWTPVAWTPVAWTPVAWTIETLIASTLLMLAVLALRRPVRRLFGPDIAYALWVLPVLRLALPPLPEAWTRVTVAPVVEASQQITILFAEPIGEGAAAPVSWAATLGPALALSWLAGAAAFIGWHVLAHRRFCRRMLAEPASVTPLSGGVRLIETAAASGPLAFGIRRRYIAVPRDFAERYEPEERDLALAHELGHHARGDLIANWVALFVVALHWCNPVAWRAFRAFRADQEIANDARVLAGMTAMKRHSYACAILKAAHGGPVSAACHLHTIEDLKGRLRMLTTIKTSRMRLLSGAGVLAILVTAGLGLTASATATAANVRTSVETATGIDLGSAEQAAPSAPAAPPVTEDPAPPSAPAAPSMPPALTQPGQHKVRNVVITKDGKTVAYDSADIDAHLAAHDRVAILPLAPNGSRIIVKDPNDPDGRIEVQDIPAVTAAKCGIGTGTPTSMVINNGRGPKRMVVICTDRIERAAAEGAAMAANSKDIERNAYRSALNGLRKARAEMLAHQGPGGTGSAEAVPAIDKAIAEVEEQLAAVK